MISSDLYTFFFILLFCLYRFSFFCFFILILVFFFFFFFQAEDGIRDGTVTGVQTCALPISGASGRRGTAPDAAGRDGRDLQGDRARARLRRPAARFLHPAPAPLVHPERAGVGAVVEQAARSEERRVGKECRYRT